MLEALHHAPPSRPSFGGALVVNRAAYASLDSDERQELDGAALPVRELKANTDLLREGDASDRLHIMVEGWACRYKTMRDGSRQIVSLLVPGDVANLDALAFGRPGYGLRIVSPAQVIAIPCDRVLGLAERHMGIARMLLRLALVENGILSQWALGLGRQSAQQRLAHLLCELGVRLAGGEGGSGGGDATSFVLPLTQEQIADALGLTPVHVNRTMQQLRALGLIATANRTITFPDPAGLRSMAEFDPAYLHAGPAMR